MLGNVKPYMPALSREEKSRYSAYYCGLCKTLGRQNGLFSRFMLNYDMTFVAMLYDDMHGENFVTEHRACFANPFRKKDILCTTEGTKFAADVLIMLAYFKLLDNIRDESLFRKAACIPIAPYLYLKYRSSAKRLPRLAEIFRTENTNQQTAEKNFTDTDRLALPTANMVKAILSACAPEKDSFAAGQLGFFLGRVIYLLDALNDREEDEKKGSFNIFNINSVPMEDARAECFMALGEISYWYRQINFSSSKNIADNIIYMSLARDIKFAGEEKEKDNGK